MKILFLGYYYYQDGYYSAGEHIRKDYDFAFFPFIKWLNKSRNISEVLDLINGTHNHKNLVNNYPQYFDTNPKNRADIVIFWHNKPYIDTNEMNILKKNTNQKTNFILVDWDSIVLNNNRWYIEIEKRMSGINFFDTIYVCSPSLVNCYKTNYKYDNIKHFYPGFNPKLSYYIKDSSYDCDVSIICTNLYEDLDYWSTTKISRKQLVDSIYKDKSIKFHFYGPEKFKELYPDSYKGFITYNDCKKVFSNSKINLNISPVGDAVNCEINGVKKHYFSERCPQILGCKGLMMCETDLEPFLLNNKHYIMIDSIDDAIIKIKDVIRNNNKYDVIRKNGYDYAINKLLWKNVLDIHV